MVAGLLHDIGKIGLPDALLAKSAPQMSADELGVFKKHPIKGEAALMALEDLRVAARLLRSHHERYDGSVIGRAERTRTFRSAARILAVANDYDGLQIGTFSAKRLSAEEARAFIRHVERQALRPSGGQCFLALARRRWRPRSGWALNCC